MLGFSSPSSFRLTDALYSAVDGESSFSALSAQNGAFAIMKKAVAPPHSSHPNFGHLLLLIFEAVLEVVCVSLPGYILARQGHFSSEMQKFAANLNVQLFTPCLIFTKLASQLNADKLVELGIIPAIFAVQTLVSYLCSVGVSRVFRFSKRPRNFVIAMGVFGNSNSLPISLVISLSQTLQGLHWDKIPGDNDDEVAARGILYLLIFQQLGQLVRWSWGYHVLLAPPDKYQDEDQNRNSQVEQGRYRDEPDEEGEDRDLLAGFSEIEEDSIERGSERELDSKRPTPSVSGSQTPTSHSYDARSESSTASPHSEAAANGNPSTIATPVNGNILPKHGQDGNFISFSGYWSAPPMSDGEDLDGIQGFILQCKRSIAHSTDSLLRLLSQVGTWLSSRFSAVYDSLPQPIQKALFKTSRGCRRFAHGLWEFMNPPLWAMLAAIIVASIPSLQRLFFSEGTFIRNSVTRAVGQSGGVAVPLILVVLGANLARNTLPQGAHANVEDEKIETKLLVASLISRMLLPTIVMAPILALFAKYVPVSILDDPIFVIVCFLLTGAPSALQLAQICQINGVYENVMSKLLFQSYVIWILPSTLILVMLALEVVEWANGLI